jgi:hypothetical protein
MVIILLKKNIDTEAKKSEEDLTGRKGITVMFDELHEQEKEKRQKVPVRQTEPDPCPHLEECRESLKVLFWKDGTGDGYDCGKCDAGQKFRKMI